MNLSLSEKLRPVFAEALASQAALRGQPRYEWELASGMMPTPTGAAVILMLHVWVPAPIIGKWLAQSSAIVDPQMVTEESAANIVRAAFEALAVQSSQILASQNGHN